MRLLRRQTLLGGLLVAAFPRAAYGDATSAVTQSRWIAGASPLPSSEPNTEWVTYARGEEERWQSAQPRLKAMLGWAAREIAPVLPKDATVFYPFAGPDVLHAVALFGSARRIVLVGLEPVGTLPESSLSPPADYFTRLGAALGDLHRLTFFRTHEMASDFERVGVLPALVATLVRLGGTVTSVASTNSPP
ncbi:MAG: hypothetical protein K0S65_4552, partial [Labilithrix sp.]|nr:hypothetical protein [Labilithrix sp.]